MQPRLKLALLVAALGAAGLLSLVTFAGPSRQGLELVQGFAGARSPAGAVAPGFALRDQDGRPVQLSDYRGQVVVLTFLYSTCQSTCPVIAQQIRGALDRLPRPVPALAVSVDPANDTPLNARRFLVKQSVVGRIRFLLGSRAQLAPIWRGYGIEPQSEIRGAASDHTSYVVLIGRDGRRRVGFPDSDLTPEALAHDILALER
ncbi:MAG: SCO family protein [Solirubrobacteraceae bacterium]